MNYKNSAIFEIEDIAIKFPTYTLGQILLAITNRKPEKVSLRDWLYSINDEDLYTEIERTNLIETEE